MQPVRPPRLQIAVYGRSVAGHTLAGAFAAAGHCVTEAETLSEAARANAIVLAVSEAELDDTAEALAKELEGGRRVIVTHSCLGRGVQALDPVEVTGAVVVALSPITPWQWAVTTLDESDRAVAAMLAGEARMRLVDVTEKDRGQLAARCEFARLARVVSAHARALLDEYAGEEILEDRPEKPDAFFDAAAIRDAYAHVEDPRKALAFADTAYHAAEILGDNELKTWAARKAGR